MSVGVACGAEVTTGGAGEGEGVLIVRPIDESMFEALFANPPFTRSVDPADTILLTGIASIDGEAVATLFDTATSKSQVVAKVASVAGWQLLGVEGDTADSRSWTAQVRVPGGEVITVRYQKPPVKNPRAAVGGSGGGGGVPGKAPPLSSGQLAEAKKAAVDYREGFSSDGYPNKPPAEMVAKLSRLSVAQREGINQQMQGYRNQGLGLEERRRIYEKLVEREGGR